jgi:type IV pilus biogenesis protein CpaD/CtpE
MRKSVLSIIILLSLSGCAGTTLKYPTKNGPIDYKTWHAPWHTMKSDLTVTLMLETNLIGSLAFKAERDSEVSEADIKAFGELVEKLAEGSAEGAVKGLKSGL